MAAMRSLGAAVLVLGLIGMGAALAQRQPADPNRIELRGGTDRERQPANDAMPAMTFRVVEGVGAGHQRRWIEASGWFVQETPEAFERFRRETDITGLTLYLDSFGGRLNASLVFGRRLRALGVSVSVGRTVELARAAGEGARFLLVTHGVQCNSACVYALMGGANRTLAVPPRLGVHQFSLRLNRDGSPLDPAAGLEEFRYAQTRMATIAQYMQEMGVDMALLPIITSVPYGEPLRYLTREEIQDTRLARIQAVPRPDPVTVDWSVFTRRDDPLLVKAHTRTLPNGRRIDDEVILRCGAAGRLVFAYRLTMVRPGEANAPVSLERVRLVSGRETFAWSRPAETRMTQQGVGATLWIGDTIPRTLLEEAVRSGQLTLEVAETREAAPALDIADRSLQASARRFLEACDLRERDRGGQRQAGQN